MSDLQEPGGAAVSDDTTLSPAASDTGTAGSDAGTGEGTANGAPVDSNDASASEGAAGTQQSAQPSWETESRAREMGWVPQNEWRGRPEMWRPAEEFVRRADEVLPIVKAEKKRLEEQARQLKDKIEQQEKTFAETAKRLERMNVVALERQKKQIWDQFEAEKLKAVQDGDPQAYESAKRAQHQALADLREQEREFSESAPAERDQPQKTEQSRISPEAQATVDGWIGRNTWFNRDPVMTAAAEAHHMQLLRERPGMSLEQNLSETERFIRETFTSKFSPPEAPKRQQPHAPAVEGGTRQAGGGPRAKGWSDLPAEAKSAGERFVNQGLFGDDPKKARDEYAREYWSQEA